MRCFVESEAIYNRHHAQHPAFFDGVRTEIYPCLNRPPPVGAHLVVEHTKIAVTRHERFVGRCLRILLEGFERLLGAWALMGTSRKLLNKVNA